MLPMLQRPLYGSLLLVFSLLRPLALFALVARSFYIAPPFLLLTPGLNWTGVISWLNLIGGIPCSGLHLSTHLTGTLSVMNFSPHVWALRIHLFPRYYVVISMLFLTEPKIVGALILLSPSGRALSLSSYSSGSFVCWMFGAISILMFALLPG